jgi:hypothetical protein
MLRDDRSALVCRSCGRVRARRKTLLCRLGFHHWVGAATEGEHYLECGRCGAYGGDPGSFRWGPPFESR